MIRIIAGKYGSRYIDAPSGRATRPTTNRVREAVFSALCSNYSDDMSLNGARVLDLFSGSGALSFEALSRGADFALAFEKNRDSFSINKKNASSLKLDKSEYQLQRGDVFSPSSLASTEMHAPFDIVMLDPPYSFLSEKVFSLVQGLCERDIVSSGALIYYEHSTDIDENSMPLSLESLYEKEFSDIRCNIYRYTSTN